MKLFKKIFGSEDAKGARTASKSVEPGSFPGTPAIIAPIPSRGWVASYWNEYMRKEGWKAYPCVKHAIEYCKECTEYDRSSICCE
jgi:hypothetical protein